MFIAPLQERRRVYCAGPLFNAAERREMEAIAAALTHAGFEPFVPHADGMEFAQVLPYLASQGCDPVEAGRVLHEAVFALDVFQVALGCGSLVFNANGRVPDEGGVAELTLAWTLGKPVVIFKEDARSAIAGRDNPLVVGQTRFRTVEELNDLAAELARAWEEHEVPHTWETALPPHLAETVEKGRRFWSQLETLGADRPSAEIGSLVWDTFGPAREVRA